MTQTTLLSSRIAGLESLVLSLPELRLTATELRADLERLQSRVAEVDALIHEGERAERTLVHLSELADRVLIAGDAMTGAVHETQPDPVAASETAPQGPADTGAEVEPDPRAEVAAPEDEAEPAAEDGAAPETDVPDETPEETALEESPADAPAGEDEASEDEPREDAAAPEETPPALTLDSLRAYLGQHPGSLPGGMAAHFGTTKTVLASLLGTLRRQGEAECLLTKPPHWYLKADLPHLTSQAEAPAPAAPLPELPPAPEEVRPAPADVNDEDLKALISHLGVQGNRTEPQIYKAFRYARGWTPEYVTQLVRAGMSQGKLASAGGTASQPRVSLVRGSARGGVQ